MSAPARLVLGVFIVGQLLFLFGSNATGLFHRFLAEPPDPFVKRTTLEKTADTVSDVTGAWSQLTNQPQHWSLFAPEPDGVSTFLVIALKPDGWGSPYSHREENSDNEPENLTRYFRMGRFRLRRYESELVLAFNHLQVYGEDETAYVERDRIMRKVRREWRPMRAYLHWWVTGKRLDTDSLSLQLKVRGYPIELPNDSTLGRAANRVEWPLAAWYPRTEEKTVEFLPIRPYNPVTLEFDTVPRRGAAP